ncbi:MAG TPA: SRPBCC family protein [Sporichthyaceae bacterium]|nr:SRPBCC family protein [Sporichthyaceae bacterium]
MGDQQKVSVSIDIAAPPEKIYAMVSDLPRMGEWSPENTGGKWIGGAKAALPGAKFMGSNKNGNRKWSVPVRITDATAPRRLEFVVGVGPIKGATWRYEIAATATGCNVTETWEDTRVGPLKNARIGKLITGVPDRCGYARTSIETTLANLKKAAES